MKDIVERLRAGDYGPTYGPSGIELEAADEIERLRAALAAEREVCAKVAESHPYEAHMEVSSFEACAQHVVTEIASAIRARTGEGT